MARKSSPKTQPTVNKDEVAFAVNQALENSFSRFVNRLDTISPDTKHQQIYRDFGYRESLVFNDHYQMYRRFSIAKAGIKVPVEICWRSFPDIFEGDEQEVEDRDEQTEWESTLNKLFKRLKLWRKIKLADEYQRIGDYGAFVVQVSGNRNQIQYDKPLGTVRDTQILNLIPCMEGQLIPVAWDQDRSSIRYGQPTMYTFKESVLINDIRQDQRNEDVNVHHSRVILFAEGGEPDSIYGVPANEAGFNELVTLVKILGSTGEAMFKSAAMKLAFSNKSKDAPQPTEAEIDAMDQALSDFVENLDKHLQLGDVDVNTISANVMNPDSPFNVHLASYAGSILIASKLLIGQQEGKLAADQDGKFTLANMQSRRESFGTQMVESVVDWLINHGAIENVEYTVVWDDLMAPSDKEKLELADKMAGVNKNMMQEVFTPEEMRQIAGYKRIENEDEEPLSEIDEEDDPQ